MGILPGNIFDIMQQWEIAQINRQKEEEKRLKQETREKHENVLSTWQVRKIYEIEVEGEYSDLCGEIVHNHLETCPICQKEYASTSSYCSLSEPRWEEVHTRCDECDSYFKLVAGEWYGYNETPKVVQISEDEYNTEEFLITDKTEYYNFVSQLKIGE
jgi:hypothetical protein